MADIAAEAPVPATLFKKRTAKANIRKRPATPPPATEDSASGSEYSSEDENGRTIKRRRKEGVTLGQSAGGKRPHGVNDFKATEYQASRDATIKPSQDATRQSNWYEENAEVALDAKTLLGKTRDKPDASDRASSNGVYKGAANYSSFAPKNPNAMEKKVGPQKAATNVRTVTVTDFAPDVCKDYKQTGFCGFGDSCKFLHAREDYKQGWELDRDWEIGTKGKRVKGQTVASANRAAAQDDDDDEDEALLESIPFACVICKQGYKNPIVTKCGHYFCERCALDRYRRNPNCEICGQGTNGVFNTAKNLKKLLDKKRDRVRQRREAAIEAGEDVSSEDEDEGDGS